MTLTLALIDEARRALRGVIHHTPLERSGPLSEALGVDVWLKLEGFQVTGSFKVRGALFRLAQLSGDERARGVVTCSAGNHGKGVAWAAKRLGVRAIIHVPSTIDAAKYAGMVACGAEVRVSDQPGYDETEVIARAHAAEAGLPFVSAFDDPWIMAGNGGTMAAEVLEDLPEARSFVLPVSGGGLAAGFARVVTARVPEPTIVAVQHEGSPGLLRSLERGAAVTAMPAVDTLAGGLEGGIGRGPFEVLRDRVGRVTLVTEAEIHDAFRWMIDTHQLLIEPTAAATVAACRSGRVGDLPGPVVVVVSGRNVGGDTVRALLRAS
ncbi:MAG: pyridoxal-phosphate dependent enzyme [Alphaproteobacteria bacterium]|nr:pyridoxal-phosphate dependent enzyme [Alphaproteobacteria bacterium]